MVREDSPQRWGLGTLRQLTLPGGLGLASPQPLMCSSHIQLLKENLIPHTGLLLVMSGNDLYIS